MCAVATMCARSQPHCEVRGDALYCITARAPSSFEVLFRDRAGRTAQAVELDVFVTFQGGMCAAHR